MAMTLAKAERHIDAVVIYTNPITRKPTDIGVIHRVDHRMVWVLYDSWPEPLPTHPANLTLDRKNR